MTRLQIPVTARDHARGPEDAPLILVEYGDFQCPFCALRHREVIGLEAALAGSLRFVYRHFPLTQVHRFAWLGAACAEAAGIQGRFWEMHDLLFERQDLLSPEGVFDLAQALHLDLEEFQGDLGRPETETRIRADYRGGIESGVHGTPSFYLNGLKYEGPLDADVLAEATAPGAEHYASSPWQPTP